MQPRSPFERDRCWSFTNAFFLTFDPPSLAQGLCCTLLPGLRDIKTEHLCTNPAWAPGSDLTPHSSVKGPLSSEAITELGAGRSEGDQPHTCLLRTELCGGCLLGYSFSFLPFPTRRSLLFYMYFRPLGFSADSSLFLFFFYPCWSPAALPLFF